MHEVTVILNTTDAETFKLFQKHYIAFKLLEEIGAFDIKTGSITLSFDNKGQIRSVEKKEMYRDELSTPSVIIAIDKNIKAS